MLVLIADVAYSEEQDVGSPSDVVEDDFRVRARLEVDLQLPRNFRYKARVAGLCSSNDCDEVHGSERQQQHERQLDGRPVRAMRSWLVNGGTRSGQSNQFAVRID